MQSLKTIKPERKNNHKVPEKVIDRTKDNRKIWFFCEGGCGWQYPTFEGRCPICHRRYIRQSTYQAVVDRFVAIYEENKDAIDKHLSLQVDVQNDFKIPVRLGMDGFYFVPLRYFIELADIERTDHSHYADFIEYLKQHCTKAKIKL